MIRPLDLQDNFSKAPLAAREQHVQQVGPESAQQHLTRELNQEHVLDHSRILATEQPAPGEVSVHRRGRTAGEQQRRRRRPSPRAASTATSPEPPPQNRREESSGHIDIIA